MDTIPRTPARKSLPLSERDMQDISKLRGSNAHRQALSQLSTAAVTESSSEAAVLHAIVEAGLKAVSEQVEQEGYAAIAADMDTQNRQEVARRRRPSWADE